RVFRQQFLSPAIQRENRLEMERWCASTVRVRLQRRAANQQGDNYRTHWQRHQLLDKNRSRSIHLHNRWQYRNHAQDFSGRDREGLSPLPVLWWRRDGASRHPYLDKRTVKMQNVLEN